MAEIYVPGPFDFVGTANALSQMQTAQQARQSNALQMQYTMEDRAREAENRKIAAGNALAARARAQKIAGVYEQGFNPGQTALMTPGIAPGPGVVRKAVEPSFDYDKTALKLLQMNEPGKAEDLYKMTEARRTAGVEYKEKDAKARLAELETSAKSYATALANVKPVLDQAISIDGLLHYVDVVDADPVLGPLAIKTGGPTEARKEAIRKMAAPKEAGGGGMTVDQIAKRLSGVSGYDLAGMNIEALQKEATLAKTEAETANVGKPAAAVPTNLAKLITEQAALPEGSPNKASYAAAIAKEIAMSDVAQTDLGKAVSERTKLKPGDPLIAQYDAYIAKLIEKDDSKAGVFGNTNEGRQLQIVNEVLNGTRLTSDPAYALAFDALYAGKSMPAYNPNTKQMELVKAPATAPASLPPPTLGKAPVAATPPLTMASVASNLRPPVQTNALSTMNGVLRPPVQANALVAPPDAPIITNAPSSASETFDLKQKETELGRPKVTVTVQKMMDSFNELDKLGAIVNDEKPINENFMAMLSGGVFADALPLINPKAATRRGVLKTLTETAISQIAAAAGLTAKQMDSNADVKRIRVMVSGPEEGFTIQAVRESLINLDAAFGTGTVKSAAPATVMPDNVKALINKYN